MCERRRPKTHGTYFLVIIENHGDLFTDTCSTAASGRFFGEPPPSPQRPPPCSPTFCGLFGVYMYTPASIHVYESYSPTQDFENNIQKLSKQNLEEKKHTWNIYISCAINCLLHLHTSITVHQLLSKICLK